MFEGVFAKRMVDGLWSAGEGLVYTSFRTGPKPQGRVVRTDIGIDYGTASTTAFVVVRSVLVETHGKKHFVYHIPEVVTVKGGSTMANKTDSELADTLFRMASKWKPRTVILDHAAASFRSELLKDRRRRFKVRGGGKDVLSGIRRLGSALAKGEVIIDHSCTELIDELNSYCWNPRKEDSVLKKMTIAAMQ